MAFETVAQFFSVDNLEHLISQYSTIGGPLAGILFPLLESFFPFLPLVVIVITNAAAFGLWYGFLYSWIGASIGSILVFIAARTIGRQWFNRVEGNHPRIQSAMEWFEKHGFGPLFLLISFPFTPSVLVNVMAGFSDIKAPQFIMAVLLGKVMMIFGMSYVGADFKDIIQNPIKSVIVIAIVALVWFLGKYIEKKYEIGKEKPSRKKDFS